jgi:hypothetical protein
VITTPRARVAAVAAGLAATGLLSSCGVAAGDTVRPGVAAEVGDTSISLDEVDDAADDLCDVHRKDPLTLGTAVSGAEVRARALQTLVLHVIGDGLAAEYDITPKPSFDQLEQAAEDAGTFQQNATLGVSYLVNVMQAVGKEEAPAGADQQAQLGAGIKAAQEWAEREGIETNPVFPDIEIGDLAVEFTRDDDLSVPVSDFARDAVDDTKWLEQQRQADSSDDYAKSLPESQRCGV